MVVALGYPGPFALLAHISAPTPLSTFTDLSLDRILGVRQGCCSCSAPRRSTHCGSGAHRPRDRDDRERWGNPVGRHPGNQCVPRRSGAPRDRRGGGVRGRRSWRRWGAGAGAHRSDGCAVGATWVFAFAPVIAVTERRRLMDCLGRSIRAARMPVRQPDVRRALRVPIFATFLTPGLPGVLSRRQPALFGLGLRGPDEPAARRDPGAFSLRYLSIAEEVPDAPVRTAPTRDRGTGAKRRR